MKVVHTEQLSDECLVHLGVPALAEEEIDVELAGNVVTVRFPLPDDVDSAHVRATYAHGAIELHAPRRRNHFAVNADASGV